MRSPFGVLRKKGCTVLGVRAEVRYGRAGVWDSRSSNHRTALLHRCGMEGLWGTTVFRDT